MVCDNEIKEYLIMRNEYFEIINDWKVRVIIIMGWCCYVNFFVSFWINSFRGIRSSIEKDGIVFCLL